MTYKISVAISVSLGEVTTTLIISRLFIGHHTVVWFLVTTRVVHLPKGIETSLIIELNRSGSDFGILRQDYGVIRSFPMEHTRFADSVTFTGTDRHGRVSLSTPGVDYIAIGFDMEVQPLATHNAA